MANVLNMANRVNVLNNEIKGSLPPQKSGVIARAVCENIIIIHSQCIVIDIIRIVIN